MDQGKAKTDSNNSDKPTEYSSNYSDYIFQDFLPWFEDLVFLTKPDLIVGIARGAIRLLDLHSISIEYRSIKIVSNSALPFFA